MQLIGENLIFFVVAILFVNLLLIFLIFKIHKCMSETGERLIAKVEQLNGVINNLRTDMEWVKGQIKPGMSEDEVIALEARIDAALTNASTLDEETTPTAESPSTDGETGIGTETGEETQP